MSQLHFGINPRAEGNLRPSVVGDAYLMSERNLIGYAGSRPEIIWPNGARVAISVVVNFKKGPNFRWEMVTQPQNLLGRS